MKRSNTGRRKIIDRWMGGLATGAAVLAPVVLAAIVAGLLIKSWPILVAQPLSELLFSSEWRPMKGAFGFLPFIISTAMVTVVAVAIAIPLSLLTAIFLAEYASRWSQRIAGPMLDILAGIPSVIFGIWGIVLVVPLVRDVIAPLIGVASSGYSILAGGIVLSIMVFPVIVQVVYEVIRTVPQGLRDASLALGANAWETTSKVVVRKAMPGIIAACILGFSRAFGETIAVLMVVGNAVRMPHHPLDAGYPLPALIANNYGEMMSIPMYDSALMFAALILLVIVLGFNLYARRVLARMERKVN